MRTYLGVSRHRPSGDRYRGNGNHPEAKVSPHEELQLQPPLLGIASSSDAGSNWRTSMESNGMQSRTLSPRSSHSRLRLFLCVRSTRSPARAEHQLQRTLETFLKQTTLSSSATSQGDTLVGGQAFCLSGRAEAPKRAVPQEGSPREAARGACNITQPQRGS